MWHMTHDTWHVTRDIWHFWRRTFSQNFSSLALTVCDIWYYEDLEEKADSINEWVTRLFVGQPRLHRVCQIFSCWIPLICTNIQQWTGMTSLAEAKVNKKRECSPPTTCHISHVTCHVSYVTCHMSHVKCNYYYFFFFWQNGEAYRWRVSYQRGLPPLVSDT